MSKARITADLGNPQLIRLLKIEAQERDCSIKDVLVRALESYFSHRLENRAILRAADSAFAEWENPLDAEYDKL